MAEGISFEVGLAEWIEAKAAMEKAVTKAAMWSVREAARKVKRSAQRRAPVRTGAYKASIRSSKQLKRDGDTVSVTVGPRGPKVHLYAGKVETRNSPMAQAYSEVEPSYPDLHEKALGRALSRYGP